MIPYSRPQLSDLYTLSQSKLLENHTFYSGTYLYSPYMAVPSPTPPRKLAHLGQRSKDYRSWLVRGLLGERFRVRFPGVISNHCLDSWWTEGGNILYESTIDLSFFQWDGWVPKLSSKERLNCPLVAQNDYEREIFVAGVHAWHLTKIARAHGLIRGQSGTSLWKPSGNDFARGYCACAVHDGPKTWRTKKMTTPSLRRFVYLTIAKILAQFIETLLFIKHISCSPSQVDVYLAQALANNLFLFQVRTAEFFPKLTTCGN